MGENLLKGEEGFLVQEGRRELVSFFQVRGEGAVKAAEVAKSRMVTSALILHQLSKLVNLTLSRWKQIPPTLKL